MENLNEFKDAYNETFKFFDENQWYLGEYSKIISKKIVVNDYKTILSLGLGHNVVSKSIIKLLESNLDSYHIIEGSTEIIREFQISNPNENKVELFQGYFEDFVPKKKYDAIEMGFILEHVDDPFLILNKYKEYLNKNGSIFIAVPNAKSLHRLIGFKSGILDDMYRLSEYDLQLGHKRYFDLDALKRLVNESDLIMTDIKGLMLKPISSEQIRKLEWNENIIEALLEIGIDYPEIANCIFIEVKLND